MKKRNRIEMMKLKISVALLFVAGSLADSGSIFLIIALMAAIEMGVCAKRLEKRGALDD